MLLIILISEHKNLDVESKMQKGAKLPKWFRGFVLTGSGTILLDVHLPVYPSVLCLSVSSSYICGELHGIIFMDLLTSTEV